MKKMLTLATLLTVALHAWAAPVDVAAARDKACGFLLNRAATGRLNASSPSVKWVHQEKNSSSASQAAYYVINTDNGFVVVAGDDRARDILAYGDRPLENMQSLPQNMRFWLDYYKTQIELLQSRPGMVVEKTVLKGSRDQSVAPMLEAMWNQGSPYYAQCPMTGDVRAQTGCAATSLAQVFYKWKYPTQPTPVIPGYTTDTWGITLEALPSVRFDWDNMLPTYNFGYYNDTNKNAVAQLMRYIGQAEQMDYTNEWGEANEEDILRACKTFGYVNAHIAYKSILYANDVDSVYIDDAEWTEMIKGELYAGRPVVYCAVSYSSAYDDYYGHAFNVDGYDATTGLFSINWGWSGTGNGYFALNAFANQGYTYNLNQLMIMGIEPPAPVEAYDPVMQPADSDYITLTSFCADWTDETPAQNVSHYTLEVNAGAASDPGVYEMVFSESFPNCTSSGSTAISKLDNYCANKGWTGSYVYEANHGLRLGSSSRNGSITTPALNMTQSGGKMTVVATMKPYSSDTNVPVRISCGASMVDVTVGADGMQTVVLECVADENQKVTFSTTESGKRVIITQVDIYSSTIDAGTRVFSIPVETGDSTSRVITDITDKFYTVQGLTAGGTFNYKVKAHYVNGTESAWSNIEEVTLFDNGPAPHGFDLGDVNHDGSVNIKDVTDLIDNLLSGGEGVCQTCADVKVDGTVNIADVTALIDLLLGGN